MGKLQQVHCLAYTTKRKELRNNSWKERYLCNRIV
jgi:hypothetical protein